MSRAAIRRHDTALGSASTAVRAAGLLATFAAVGLWASPAQAGCSKDTDCKGDRVCDDGKCVLPPPSAAPAAPAIAPQPAPAAPGPLYYPPGTTYPPGMPSAVGLPPPSAGGPPMERSAGAKALIGVGVTLAGIGYISSIVAGIVGLSGGPTSGDTCDPDHSDMAVSFVPVAGHFIAAGIYSDRCSNSTYRNGYWGWAGASGGAQILGLSLLIPGLVMPKEQAEPDVAWQVLPSADGRPGVSVVGRF